MLIEFIERHQATSEALFIDQRGETSGSELLQLVKQHVQHLRSFGISEKSRVVLITENTIQTIALHLAIVSLNAVVVPLEISNSNEEIQQKISHAKPAYIVASQKLSFLESSFAAVTQSSRAPSYIYKNQQNTSLSDEGCLTMIFSSGTGGKEKLIMLSEKSVEKVIQFYMDALKDYSVVLSVLPLSAIYPCVICLASLCTGKKVVLFDLKGNVLEALNKYKVDVFPAVPLIVEKIHQNISGAIESQSFLIRNSLKAFMKFSGFSRRFLGWNAGKFFFKKIHAKFGSALKVILSGGAALNRHALVELYQLGFNVYEGYGLTETAGVVTYRKDDFSAFGTVGVPVEDVQIKIKTLDDQKEGEVLIQTDRLMMGYFEDSEATSRALIDGWLHTGDLGFFDKKGNLTISGRIKDVIVCADETKHLPEELEKMYDGIKGISEFAIVGVRDPNHSGDKIVIAVVKSDTISQDEIQKQITQKMQSIDKKFHIQQVKFLDALPRNKLGKICRQKIF